MLNVNAEAAVTGPALQGIEDLVDEALSSGKQKSIRFHYNFPSIASGFTIDPEGTSKEDLLRNAEVSFLYFDRRAKVAVVGADLAKSKSVHVIGFEIGDNLKQLFDR